MFCTKYSFFFKYKVIHFFKYFANFRRKCFFLHFKISYNASKNPIFTLIKQETGIFGEYPDFSNIPEREMSELSNLSEFFGPI